MKNSARVDAVCRDLGLPMLCSTRVVQPGWLHLPPATQALAAEPRRVARARRAVRDGDGAGLAAPSAARDGRASGARACWVAGPPRGCSVRSCRAGTPAIRRRLSASLLFGTRERAAPACTEGRGGARRRDAATHRRPGVPPAGARREHPPEYPGTAGWLDARGHLHIGVRCGGDPPGRRPGRQPGAVDD